MSNVNTSAILEPASALSVSGIDRHVLQQIADTYRLSVTKPAMAEKVFLLEHASRLERALEFNSNPAVIRRHPSFGEIVSFRPEIVAPIALDRIGDEPWIWLEVLRAVAIEEPVPKRHYGNIEAMTNDWKRWATERNYV